MSVIPHDRAMMPCSAFLDVLEEVADRAADPFTISRAAVHAGACSSCADRLAAAEAYRRALRRAAASERAPGGLRETIARRLQEERGSPTR